MEKVAVIAFVIERSRFYWIFVFFGAAVKVKRMWVKVNGIGLRKILISFSINLFLYRQTIFSFLPSHDLAWSKLFIAHGCFTKLLRLGVHRAFFKNIWLIASHPMWLVVSVYILGIVHESFTILRGEGMWLREEGDGEGRESSDEGEGWLRGRAN